MGKEGALYNDFKKMIDLYKYKNDVHLMEGLSSVESDHIVSSAYAMIFPDQLDKSVNTLLTAIKYEVPSIVTKTGSLSDAGGNSVLHYESESISDLAGKMMLLFKDEKFRRNLVENSRSWVDKKNFQHGLEETWQIIQTAGNKNKNIDNGHLYVRNKILKDN